MLGDPPELTHAAAREVQSWLDATWLGSTCNVLKWSDSKWIKTKSLNKLKGFRKTITLETGEAAVLEGRRVVSCKAILSKVISWEFQSQPLWHLYAEAYLIPRAFNYLSAFYSCSMSPYSYWQLGIHMYKFAYLSLSTPQFVTAQVTAWFKILKTKSTPRFKV